MIIKIYAEVEMNSYEEPNMDDVVVNIANAIKSSDEKFQRVKICDYEV